MIPVRPSFFCKFWRHASFANAANCRCRKRSTWDGRKTHWLNCKWNLLGSVFRREFFSLREKFIENRKNEKKTRLIRFLPWRFIAALNFMNGTFLLFFFYLQLSRKNDRIRAGIEQYEKQRWATDECEYLKRSRLLNWIFSVLTVYVNSFTLITYSRFLNNRKCFRDMYFLNHF